VTSKLLDAYNAVRWQWMHGHMPSPEAMSKLGDAVSETVNPQSVPPRICAHIVPMETYKTHVVFTQTFKDGIAKHYKYNPAGYTHVDVYSPPEVGERLLYRVQL